MNSIPHLLQAIRQGKHGFHPDGSTHDAIRDFQPIAETLAEADAMGLLRGFDMRKESHTGYRWWNVALVHGLSPEGEQYLRDTAAG